VSAARLTEGGAIIGWAGGQPYLPLLLRRGGTKCRRGCLPQWGKVSPQVTDGAYPPMGDSRRRRQGGFTHSNYPHLASPFGRGVLRKQDGEGVLPCVRGGDGVAVGGVVLSLKLSLLSLPLREGFVQRTNLTFHIDSDD